MKTISGVLIILVLEMTVSSLGSPFLYNAAPLFLQSIFRSSSGVPDNGTQNVEDLRTSDDPSKLANLKANRRHFARQQTDAGGPNEATPNFFQKKVEKVLYKLRLISQLSGPFDFGGAPNREPDEFDFGVDSAEGNDTAPATVSASATTGRWAVDGNRPQRFSVNLPGPSGGAAEAELGRGLGADDEGAAHRVSPGTIGVFLVEMLGTVLTLIYGAAVQNNNENNTAPALI